MKPSFLYTLSDDYLAQNRFYFLVRPDRSNEYFSVNGQRAAPEQSSLSAQNLPLTTVVAGNSIIDALQYA